MLCSVLHARANRGQLPLLLYSQTIVGIVGCWSRTQDRAIKLVSYTTSHSRSILIRTRTRTRLRSCEAQALIDSLRAILQLYNHNCTIITENQGRHRSSGIKAQAAKRQDGRWRRGARWHGSGACACIFLHVAALGLSQQPPRQAPKPALCASHLPC